MEHTQIERINELGRLSRERGLTAEEVAEQAALRAQYVAEFKENTRQALENVRIKRPDGTLEPLHKKKG